MITVVLPLHLRTLARVDGEVELEVSAPVTTAAVLDALEARFPMLRGTVREHDTGKRRPKVRFYADGEDVSLQPADTPLPAAIVEGRKPFMIIGAISGG